LYFLKRVIVGFIFSLKRLLNILLDTQSKKRKRQLEKLDESQLEESHIDEPADVKFPT
jgi:hypothetical protein